MVVILRKLQPLRVSTIHIPRSGCSVMNGAMHVCYAANVGYVGEHAQLLPLILLPTNYSYSFQSTTSIPSLR